MPGMCMGNPGDGFPRAEIWSPGEAHVETVPLCFEKHWLSHHSKNTILWTKQVTSVSAVLPGRLVFTLDYISFQSDH